MKARSLYFVMVVVSLAGCLGAVPLAEEIISKDLVITNQQQFEQKVASLLRQVKALLIARVTVTNKKDAADLYTRLSTVLEAYKDRYALSKQLEDDAMTYLHDLSLKFRLQSANSWIIPITDVSVAAATPGTLEDIFVFALNDKGRPLTQTEAYLIRPELREGLVIFFDNVKQYYPRVVERGYYGNVIKQVIQQERNMRDYYVAYHAQKNYFILFYDLIKEVFSRLEGKNAKAAFDYLRVPGAEEFNINLAEILKQGFETDHQANIINIFLSVNLSLFGNTYLQDLGESTFEFFINNASINPPEQLWESLFKSLKLKSSYIYQATELLNYLSTSEGNLLQIFIPRNKINNYVYLCVPLGVPLAKTTITGYHLHDPITVTNQQKVTYNPKTIAPETYLKIYRNHPEAIHREAMDFIQARILLTNDFLLNPDSGVKIYRYNTISVDNMRIYKQKLKELVDRMLKESMQENAEPITTST